MVARKGDSQLVALSALTVSIVCVGDLWWAALLLVYFDLLVLALFILIYTLMFRVLCLGGLR